MIQWMMVWTSFHCQSMGMAKFYFTNLSSNDNRVSEDFGDHVTSIGLSEHLTERQCRLFHPHPLG